MNSEKLKRFRDATQYGIAGKFIKAIQYRELRKIDFTGKHVLEIGAGEHMDHIQYWNTMPKSYTAADIDREYLKSILKECMDYPFRVRTLLLSEDWQELTQYDIVIAFNLLEHLLPIDHYLDILKKITGEIFIGSVPAEGGMAWGLGRRLISWNWMKTNGMDPHYEIAKNHPTCSRCIIAGILRSGWDVQYRYWPFVWSRNLSLILNIYTKEV